MWSSSGWLPRLALGVIFLLAIQGGYCEHEPTESECRPYIEKALKDHHVDSEEPHTTEASIEQEENSPTDEQAESNDDSQAESQEDAVGGADDETKTEETSEGESTEGEGDENKTDEEGDTQEEQTIDAEESTERKEQEETSDEGEGSQEGPTDNEESEGSEGGDTNDVATSQEEQETEGTEEGSQESESTEAEGDAERETDAASEEQETAEVDISAEADTVGGSSEVLQGGEEEEASQEGGPTEKDGVSNEGGTNEEGDATETAEAGSQEGDSTEENEAGSQEGDTTENDTGSLEERTEVAVEGSSGEASEDAENDTAEEPEGNEGENVTEEGSGAEESDTAESVEGGTTQEDADDSKQSQETQATDATEETVEKDESLEGPVEEESTEVEPEKAQADEEGKSEEGDSAQEVPEEDLTKEAAIPANLRPRDHITQILKLDQDSVETESALAKNTDNTLRTLKNIYDTAIKPLELLFKYRDLSNRHFGDPEIFSKPLILFMGPWSGGKSSTINYLLDNEFTDMSLRTGAEPSPAYFNILMHGDEPEILDGTQLAADWTFSGLQKFGQGLLDRLRGVRLPNRLLEKVNIVEIPGILEIRKQVQRLFPFNDACQWFIDRADIIFLVYDPAKLDVGPETEAILDQLKGREYQTRIILNKADQVKPEELMRVQGTLIWNISPLMSSPEPPVMYTTSLWSLPYEDGAPTRLLYAQERAFLRDLREAIDKRVDNKIASARRFAVRVRNHAKMVDCYLTTYFNHKTFFGNRKAISDDIIENPSKYHIYEGLSTLTNISRYDLPDPDMYRDFFRLNPLYEFTKLSDTCTYFRGCPINKLDVAIAYDLPELVGKYKKSAEVAKHSHS